MEALILPANLDALKPIGHYIMGAGKAAGLDEDAIYNLRLAVDEIATNIIVHGYQEAGLSGSLQIQVMGADQGGLEVQIEDTAKPFDPRGWIVTLEKDLPASKRAIGGLGLYLARQSVDNIFYERIGNRNRNTLIVKKPLSPAQKQSVN